MEYPIYIFMRNWYWIYIFEKFLFVRRFISYNFWTFNCLMIIFSILGNGFISSFGSFPNVYYGPKFLHGVLVLSSICNYNQCDYVKLKKYTHSNQYPEILSASFTFNLNCPCDMKLSFNVFECYSSLFETRYKHYQKMFNEIEMHYLGVCKNESKNRKMSENSNSNIVHNRN